MNARFEQWIGDGLARWTGVVIDRALAVCLVFVLASVGVGFYTTRNLGINADLEAMFSADLPYMVLEHEFEERFPVLDRNVLIVIDADTTEQAGEAADALVSRMRSSQGLFHTIYLPRDEFFDEHAFLYMDLDDLRGLSSGLATAWPLLGGLSGDPTLRGFSAILGRGLSAAGAGEAAAKPLEAMLDRFDEAVRAVLDGRDYRLSWAEVAAGRDFDVGERRRFVLAEPVLDLTKWVAGEEVMSSLRRWADELEAAGGVRIRLSGNMALNYEEMGLVQYQSQIAGAGSFLLVSALLVFAMRSYRLVFSTMITLVVGLLWTAGAAAATVGHLNVISMSFAVIVLGLNADAGIHVCVRYQELAAAGAEHYEAMRETMRDVGTSIMLCGVTTAVGFYAFVPTDFAGVAELGVIAGNGIFVGLFACFTLLPALITLMLGRGHSIGNRAVTGGLHALPQFSTRYPRCVAAGALVLGVGGALMLPRVYFDQNPLHVRDPGAESVKVLEELMRDGGASPWDLSAVSTDLDGAERLSERLRGLPEVEKATTLRDFVPGQQEQKLALLEGLASLAGRPVQRDEGFAEPTFEEQIEALRGLEQLLSREPLGPEGVDAGKRFGSGGASAIVDSSMRLRDSLRSLLEGLGSDEEAGATIATLERSLLGGLPDQLAALRRAVTAGPVTLENLPPGLVRRMLSRAGEARVRISPVDDMNDNDALDGFVLAVQSVAPDVTGSAVRIHVHAREAVRAFQQALGAAILIIAVLVFMIWRNVGDTVLVMMPLTLAAVLTAASSVLLNIPFNFANIVVLPLLLGIGVDSGIHLVHRSHHGGVGRQHLLETSTARGVFFSSLTTIASFGTLAFATHRGMASIGRLLTVGVGLALVCNLFILPALIELRSKKAVRRASAKVPA